jgi:hypothetical protein
MTTVYQAYFIGHLVNPGFEKRITTLNELMQCGIQYGYNDHMDVFIFSDPVYEIIRTNRKTCKSRYKCLQRVIERKDFATIFDSFHAEYFRTGLLFHNIYVPLSTLQEVIITFRVPMYMAKGDPLLYRFNQIITGMFEAGLFENWVNNFMSGSRLGVHLIDDDDTNFADFVTKELNPSYTIFSLDQLKVVFYILQIGQIFSTLVFLVEVLYHRACTTA